MPGNIISINDWADFYVGDSKMSGLIAYLDEQGLPENEAAKELLQEEKGEIPIASIIITRKQLAKHVRKVRPGITILSGKLSQNPK